MEYSHRVIPSRIVNTYVFSTDKAEIQTDLWLVLDILIAGVENREYENFYDFISKEIYCFDTRLLICRYNK